MKINEKIKSKKKLIILLIGIMLIFSIFSIIFFISQNKRVLYYINKNDYNKVLEIYKTISGNREKEIEIEDEIKNVVNNTIENFNDGKTNYEESKTKLETIKEMNLKNIKLEESLKELEELNNSKISYVKANEYYKNNDYYNSIIEYSNVIEKDKNYEETEKNIDEIIKKYKSEVFAKIEDNSSNYNDTLELLEKLRKIIPNDTEVQAKIDIAKDKALENLKNNQEVQAISTSLYTGWYSSSIDGITVIVKNNSEKVVKNFWVTILAYDENGYPLQISYNDTKFYGKGDLVNIQPGATYGDENYYNIYYNEQKMSKVIACIKKVEYYDGTNWENPYYNYWIEKYDNKQYSE